MAEFHDAIIIGGGPAGLTAGIYLMRGGIGTLLLEKVFAGGMPVNTERVENYPGFPEGISGRELMERFAAHAKAFEVPIKEFSEVSKVTLDGKVFTIKTSEDEYRSAGIIVAVGTESMKLSIPGEDTLMGRGVSYCVTCDGMFFRNMNVAVIGGGDSAIEEGLSLANLVRKVYVIHRRDILRAQKILQERAFRNSKMEFLWNKKLVGIVGKDQVEYVMVEDTKTGERSEVEVSGVFIYAGYRANAAFLGDLVDRDQSGFIITDEGLATKTEGLFAAGDVRKKTLKQISTAVGDGAFAAVNLEKYILENKS